MTLTLALVLALALALALTLTLAFQVDVRWDSSYEKLRDMVREWEAWMSEQNAAAPAGVNRGYFTSGSFHWWDTNRITLTLTLALTTTLTLTLILALALNNLTL